jgi:hypothetical protein
MTRRRRGPYTFATVGTPEHAVEEIQRRYSSIVTRIRLPPPPGCDEERWTAALAGLRTAEAA